MDFRVGDRFWGGGRRCCRCRRRRFFRLPGLLRNETNSPGRAGEDELVNSLLVFASEAKHLYFPELREHFLKGSVGGVDVALEFGEGVVFFGGDGVGDGGVAFLRIGGDEFAEVFGFDTARAQIAPPGFGELGNEDLFHVADGLVVGDEAGFEILESGAVFMREHDLGATQPMTPRVRFRRLFAGLGFGSGAEFGILAIRSDLSYR